MHFNNKKAWAEMIKQQAAERAIMRAHGMPECSINSIFTLDEEQLRSDRRFCVHIGYYIEPGGEALKDTGPASALDLMDEIEDERLYKALSNLKPQERDLIILHAAEGLPLRFIAALWDKPYNTTKSLYLRAINKIKKFF